MANCEKYRYMICGLVDGELTAEQEAELRAHLDTCQDCTRVYNAVSGISDAISEDLAEPPESLSKGIMNKIRSSSGSGKIHHFAFGRFTALAACIALVLLAGTKFGWFGGNLDKGTPELASMRDANSFDFSEDSEASEGIEAADDNKSLAEAPLPYSSDVIEEGAQFKLPGNNMLTSGGSGSFEASVTETLAARFNEGKIDVFEGSSTKEAPLLSISESMSKDSLIKILYCSSEDASAIELAKDQDYTLLFSDGSILRIWYADGTLCYDFGDDNVFVASGSSDDFKDFILQAIEEK